MRKPQTTRRLKSHESVADHAMDSQNLARPDQDERRCQLSDQQQTPLTLSPGQIALRDIAIQQISKLLGTLDRLEAITGEQADKEVVMDIRNDLKQAIVLFTKWFGTSPVDQ